MNKYLKLKKNIINLFFLFFLFSLFSLFYSCSNKTYLDKEEERRANLELQSVNEMVYNKEIAPIEFEFNSAKLKESSYSLLDKVYYILIRYPRLKLIVSGHTDDIGSDEYNDHLSLLRADAVKTYLVRKGIYPDSIRVYGYGKRKPVLEEKNNRARSLNRRVEFKLTTREWETVY